MSFSIDKKGQSIKATPTDEPGDAWLSVTFDNDEKGNEIKKGWFIKFT